MSESISKLMIQDHIELFSILSKIGETSVDAPQQFREFRDRLSSHIALEEQVIFSPQNVSGELEEQARRMKEEHVFIVDLLRSLERHIDSGAVELVVSDFIPVLDEHRKFEEQFLYPSLERIVDEKSRRLIFLELKRRLPTVS